MSSRREFLRGALALGAAAVVGRIGWAEPAPVKSVLNESAELNLADGRTLAYAECGDPAGNRVVIHVHGLPSCRLEILIYSDIVANYPGLRILAPDRPGLGGSTQQPGASIQTWPADLAAFTDALKIERFALIAPSAGAPYALAAARAMPQRVTNVTLVGPMIPSELNTGRHPGSGQKELNLVQKHPTLSTRIIGRKVRGNDEKKREGLVSRLTTPASKRELLADPKFGETYRRVKSETFRQGVGPVIASILQISAPWSSWLGEVTTPVTILHGTQDKTVPPELAPILAAALPNAELRYIEGTDHLGLPARHPELLLDTALVAK